MFVLSYQKMAVTVVAFVSVSVVGCRSGGTLDPDPAGIDREATMAVPADAARVLNNPPISMLLSSRVSGIRVGCVLMGLSSAGAKWL